MKRLSLIAILGAAALALAATTTLALARGPRGGPGPGGHDGRGARIAELLKLDDKQKTALGDLREDMRDDVQSIREQIRAKHEAMKTLWKAATPDRAKLVAALNEIQALQGQIALRHLDFVFAARPILSAEQFQKFVDFMGERGFGRGGHGPGRGFGPPAEGGHGPGCPMMGGPPDDGDGGEDAQ